MVSRSSACATDIGVAALTVNSPLGSHDLNIIRLDSEDAHGTFGDTHHDPNYCRTPSLKGSHVPRIIKPVSPYFSLLIETRNSEIIVDVEGSIIPLTCLIPFVASYVIHFEVFFACWVMILN